jgi:hypothetical protein
LKFKGPLRIVCNMWKVFTRPTCASDFFNIIIKMESYKEEKIVSWSGKMLFSNHLP